MSPFGPFEHIRALARLSLMRALGFATLGIGTMIVALSWEPALALMTGAALTAMLAAVLWYKAFAAPTRNYRQTEVWIMLEKRHGLAEESAQRVIGGILREQYARTGEYAAMAAGVQWLLSIAWRLA